MSNISIISVSAWSIIILVIGLTSGFPIQHETSDGQVNVLGTIVQSQSSDYNQISIDIGSTGPIEVILVDDQDRFHVADSRVENIAQYRYIFTFQSVPKDSVIKRLRIQFKENDRADSDNVGEPFSVDWESFPQTNNTNGTMIYYGNQIIENKNPSLFHTKGWVFDIKVTNTGSDVLQVSDDDFAIRDQFNWLYVGNGRNEVDLMPGESMRFNLDILMSSISRPVLIEYNGMTLDISAWT